MTNKQKLQNHYPEIAKAYEQISNEQYELFASKMMDYGKGNISVGSNLETEQEVNTIQLLGNDGRVLDQVSFLNDQLNIQGWSSGIYIVQIETDQGVITRRLVVE